MASKNYRKFMATGITAAVVASAVAPVASAATFTDVPAGAWYKQAVDYVSGKGYMTGTSATTFAPTKDITRAEAATLFANKLDLYKDGQVAGFADVKTNAWYHNAVAAVKEGNIMGSTGDNMFAPNRNITRGEVAALIVRAYGLTGTGASHSFTDVDNSIFKNDISTLVEWKIADGKSATKFAPTDLVSRAEMAAFIQKADEATAKAEVTAVSAINATTLKVDGSGLKSLKAEDITIDGVTVKSVTSTDGKTATVTLDGALAVDKEYTAKVKMNGETKEFKFTFGIAVTSVSLDEKTYDDDTASQKLSFKVNGESATADTEWLRQAGYSVKFIAVDSNNTAANIFLGGSNESSTGVLLSDIATTGKYTVEIQIIKDGKVVVSDKSGISIEDVESTVTALSFTNFHNSIGFDHNSSTLVTGESATIDYLEGNAAGKTDASLNPASATVTSSDDRVISVSNQTLTANAPGTATITVKVGNATKTYNFTVTNAVRSVAKVTPSEATVKVVNGATRQINVVTTDQYGDPIAVANTDAVIVEDLPQNASGTPLVSVGTSNELVTGASNGKHAGFAVTGAANGTGTVLFKNTSGTVLGQIAVTVTGVNNVASNKLELVYNTVSKDNALVLGKPTDDTVTYQVSNFNTEGAYNGAVALTLATDTTPADGVVDSGFFPKAANSGYYVVSSKPSVATVGVANTSELTVTAQGKGSADIVIYDENGLVKHKFTVTVTSNPVITTGVKYVESKTVNFVGKSVKVTDFLDVRTDAALDPIVYGVTHNATTISKVRLDKAAGVADENGTTVTATVTAPVLYIDKNNDGDRDASEVVLGIISATPLTGEQLSANFPAAGTGIDLIAGQGPTVASDKGTLLFRVIDDSNADGVYSLTETLSTTTLNIDVK